MRVVFEDGGAAFARGTSSGVKGFLLHAKPKRRRDAEEQNSDATGSEATTARLTTLHSNNWPATTAKYISEDVRHLVTFVGSALHQRKIQRR